MKANWILCLAAGMIGATLAHFAWIQPVHAQVFQIVPRQVRAQQVVLVDQKDKTFATLDVTEINGKEVFEIIGKDGHIIARAGAGPQIIQ